MTGPIQGDRWAAPELWWAGGPDAWFLTDGVDDWGEAIRRPQDNLWGWSAYGGDRAAWGRSESLADAQAAVQAALDRLRFPA